MRVRNCAVASSRGFVLSSRPLWIAWPCSVDLKLAKWTTSVQDDLLDSVGQRRILFTHRIIGSRGDNAQLYVVVTAFLNPDLNPND